MFICIVLSLASFAYFNKERLVDVLSELEVSFPQQSDQNTVRGKIEREAAAILADTGRKNKRAYEAAMTELGGINGAFDRAEEGIEPTVNELGIL